MRAGPDLSATAVEAARALPGPILVLGAGGFVGANLFRALAALRKDVFAVVRTLPAWRLEGIDPSRVLQANIADPGERRELVEHSNPQVVFDCIAYGGYSFEKDIDRIIETNLTMKVHLLELLSQRTITAYIHAGTSSEYGLNCRAPAEDAPLQPNSHYATTKAGLAQHIGFMGKVRHLPCLNLRLYSVYGPLEDGARLLPAVVARGLESTYPDFVNPEISRDFIYVDDVCEAFILAAARLTPDHYGDSINIGTGRKTTIRDLAGTSRDVFGIKDEPKFGSMENRAWDLAEWYANPAKALAVLGWQARTSLADGLRGMAAWLRDKGTLETKFSTQNGPSRSVSAIVACYKDEQAIPVMYQRLTDVFTKLGIEYEIIFVNDCSPDQSSQVITELSDRDPHVVGIVHSRNFGSQMAFRSAMEVSTKDAVVLLDGDLQDPPELIEQLYAQWCQGFDVVFGRRVKRDMPAIWGMLYKAFYRVFAALSYIPIPRDAGDFSLIDKRAVGWLLRCPERDLFLRGLRAYVGFRQTGVDYVRPERMFGTSTNNLRRNIEWAKRGIFSFSNVPLTVLSSGGLLMLGLSIALGLGEVIMRLLAPSLAPPGFTTLILLILGFGGLNLFAIGTVGEYVGKVLIEVKGRPRFIREKLIRHGRTIRQLPDGHSI